MADVPGYAIATDFGSFQAALDSKPGTLYVPPGTYNLGSGATLNRSKQIIGCRLRNGTPSTLTSSGAFVLRIADGVNYCGIEKLRFQPASNSYAIEIGTSEGHHIRSLSMQGSGPGFIKATGAVRRSIFEQMVCFGGTVLGLDFSNSDQHENCIFSNIFCSSPVVDPYHIRGRAMIIVGGATDHTPESSYKYHFGNGSRGCAGIGVDDEGGNGGAVRAVGDSCVAVLGMLWNTNGTDSGAPPVLRAESGAKLVLLGGKRLGGEAYSVFSSTTGTGSAIIMLETSGSGLKRGSSGNVKLLQDGSWS